MLDMDRNDYLGPIDVFATVTDIAGIIIWMQVLKAIMSQTLFVTYTLMVNIHALEEFLLWTDGPEKPSGDITQSMKFSLWTVMLIWLVTGLKIVLLLAELGYVTYFSSLALYMQKLTLNIVMWFQHIMPCYLHDRVLNSIPYIFGTGS